MANWIHDIEIKNFKSIRQAKVEDCRRINVFIGYPNVGKSNILEALGLLTYIQPRNRPTIKELVRCEALTQLFHFYNIQQPAEINFNSRYSLIVQYKAENLAGFHLKDNTETSAYFEAVSQRSLETDIDGTRRYSSETNGVEDFSGRILSLQNFRVRPYKFSAGKKFVNGYSALELKVPFGENMFEVVASSEVLKTQFTDLLKDYNLKMAVNFEDNSIAILLPQSNSNVIYPITFSLLADTLVRLIFFKAAIYSNKNSVLLFEEPEAHMFPPYISKFTTDIMYDDNSNQYFIATHSPFVINDFMENLKYEELSIYVVGYKKESGETEIRRLTEEELHEIYQYGIDLFLNVGNFLESE